MKTISDKNELLETIKFIVEQTSDLSYKIVGKTFPIKSLTIFAHSEQEFELLSKLLSTLGKSFDYNNGPRVKLYEPIRIGNNTITHLRIRKPDVDRPQVGCNDFETNYTEFKNEYLTKYPNNLRLIVRPEYEMIEFFDTNFPVLAYVVSKS